MQTQINDTTLLSIEQAAELLEYGAEQFRDMEGFFGYAKDESFLPISELDEMIRVAIHHAECGALDLSEARILSNTAA